jgi:hypothetical protein
MGWRGTASSRAMPSMPKHERREGWRALGKEVVVIQGVISKFYTQCDYLSRFDIQFVSLSKIDTDHMNCFDSGDTFPFSLFSPSEMTIMPSSFSTTSFSPAHRLHRRALVCRCVLLDHPTEICCPPKICNHRCAPPRPHLTPTATRGPLAPRR